MHSPATCTAPSSGLAATGTAAASECGSETTKPQRKEANQKAVAPLEVEVTWSRRVSGRLRTRTKRKEASLHAQSPIAPAESVWTASVPRRTHAQTAKLPVPVRKSGAHSLRSWVLSLGTYWHGEESSRLGCPLNAPGVSVCVNACQKEREREREREGERERARHPQRELCPSNLAARRCAAASSLQASQAAARMGASMGIQRVPMRTEREKRGICVPIRARGESGTPRGVPCMLPGCPFGTDVETDFRKRLSEKTGTEKVCVEVCA